jgi:hypothetical protein
VKPTYQPVDSALLPRDPVTLEPLQPRRQPGYYSGFSTLSQSPFWDDATRRVVEHRVKEPPARKFFSAAAWDFWAAVFEHLIPQADRTPDRQIPLIPMLDDRLTANRTVGYRYEDMPHDRVVYELGIEAIDSEAERLHGGKFLTLSSRHRDEVLKVIEQGKPRASREIWKRMSVKRFWQMIMTDAIDAYYAHPWAWDEIGFGGPAYPRAYTRLERGEPEPWEVKELRYDWLPPTTSVSGEIDASGDDDQSHHGSGGSH